MIRRLGNFWREDDWLRVRLGCGLWRGIPSERGNDYAWSNVSGPFEKRVCEAVFWSLSPQSVIGGKWRRIASAITLCRQSSFDILTIKGLFQTRTVIQLDSKMVMFDILKRDGLVVSM